MGYRRGSITMPCLCVDPIIKRDEGNIRDKHRPLAGGLMTALLPADISSLFLDPDLHASCSPIAMRAGDRIIGLSRMLGDCRF